MSNNNEKWGQGRLSALNELLVWADTQIEKIKGQPAPPSNSPKQISNGAALKMLNSLKVKIRAKIKTTTEKA